MVFPSALAADQHWSLDPTLTFLNHGSYGSVPKAALRAQAALRERVERDPVRFYKVDLEGLLDDMREQLGAFIRLPRQRPGTVRERDVRPLPHPVHNRPQAGRRGPDHGSRVLLAQQ